MDLNNISFSSGLRVHFVGAGGIGMSALAHILYAKGMHVSGSDVGPFDADFSHYYPHAKSHISYGIDFIVRSYAVLDENEEITRARELGIPVYFYPEVLGAFAKRYSLITVAGSHGKSTTTAMLAQILIECGIDPTVIVGTKVPFLGNKNYRIGESKYLLIEACEYMNAFHNYYPEFSIITNIEADHLDYFKTNEAYFRCFEKFMQQVSVKCLMYADAFTFISPENQNVAQVVETPTVSYDLKVMGQFNQRNAHLAVNMALCLGVDLKDATCSVERFEGTWRRLEYKGACNGADVYDDYGHHPTEIAATTTAVREKFPDARIILVYQPHQYARLISLYADFVSCFSSADMVIVPNIYKVRDSEEDVAHMNVARFVHDINAYEKKSEFAVDGGGFENTVMYLKSVLKSGDICVIMGAGDVPAITTLLLTPTR